MIAMVAVAFAAILLIVGELIRRLGRAISYMGDRTVDEGDMRLKIVFGDRALEFMRLPFLGGHLRLGPGYFFIEPRVYGGMKKR